VSLAWIDECPDGVDRILDLMDEADRTAIAKQKALLMRLNRAELVVLANHYGIKNVTDYTAPHDWKFGGKEELACEIAEHMIEDGQ